ncbi:hypothetical protein [Bacillus sp. B1-b2]|uniref:hypothetical protein n=1 Tax=Bacillus sp. B1-b2 TaxID=2653201 RepID=UPI0018697958|nr:hypothetical protein [Bacillus sp. B1-b2]
MKARNAKKKKKRSFMVEKQKNEFPYKKQTTNMDQYEGKQKSKTKSRVTNYTAFV